jgi:hypothetical protein
MNYKNLRIKKIANGQTLITCGISQYRVETIEESTRGISYNLLLESNLLNNPKHKNRYKFIDNFKNFDNILKLITESSICKK